jgi:hypothetical protein
MARPRREVDRLLERIEALDTRDRLRLLERALTPQMELRLLVERIRRRTSRVPGRVLDRAIDQAVREVRRERAARAT